MDNRNKSSNKNVIAGAVFDTQTPISLRKVRLISVSFHMNISVSTVGLLCDDFNIYSLYVSGKGGGVQRFHLGSVWQMAHVRGSLVCHLANCPSHSCV